MEEHVDDMAPVKSMPYSGPSQDILHTPLTGSFISLQVLIIRDYDTRSDNICHRQHSLKGQVCQEVCQSLAKR